MSGRITIKKVAKEPAVKIRCSKYPISNGECQVHIDLHHQTIIVMGGMVAPDRVDKRAIPHEPILVYMAVKMHELINKIHPSGRANEQPGDV